MFLRIFIFSFILLSACTKKPDLKEKALSIKALSQLATVEYVVTKVIKATDDKTWFKPGNRKILMSCKASIIAGIDLSKIKDEQISVDGKTVRIVLPHAELIALNIKPEDVKVEYEAVSPFRSSFSIQEKNELASQGEKNIRNSIDSLGVLQTAEVNANLVVTNFLNRLGFDNVIISYDQTKPMLQ
jgi:hypothetical protein